MKTRDDAQRIVEWLRATLGKLPVTTKDIANAGLMPGREATDAIQYGLRHRVFERVDEDEERLGGRVSTQRGCAVRYRWTGLEVPAVKGAARAPSFDGLLSVWR